MVGEPARRGELVLIGLVVLCCVSLLASLAGFVLVTRTVALAIRPPSPAATQHNFDRQGFIPAPVRSSNRSDSHTAAARAPQPDG
jgi:hypothetical protein